MDGKKIRMEAGKKALDAFVKEVGKDERSLIALASVDADVMGRATKEFTLVMYNEITKAFNDMVATSNEKYEQEQAELTKTTNNFLH